MSDKEAKGYKPMMSEKEAADYARDSVFGDTSMFHGASGASIDRKTTSGVNVARATRGVYGQGFYMTPVEKEADTYAMGAPRNGEPAYLEAKVKVKKPFVTTDKELKALQTKLDEAFETIETGEWTTKMLKANGYDSIYVKDLGYFVAFDGRQVASFKKHTSKLDKDKAYNSKNAAEKTNLINDWRKQDGRFEELKRMGG